MMNNELSVIKSAQQGNTTSFCQLVTTYQKQLNCYLVTKCYNSHDTEDIVQETFMNAYKYIQSYNEEWKFSTWLYTIANRLVKKHNDFYNKHEDYEVSESVTEIEEETLNGNNIWTQIRCLLNSFAFDVVWFYYVEEFKIREIAHILECSQSTIKMSLFRSKKKLARSKDIQLLFQEFTPLELVL